MPVPAGNLWKLVFGGSLAGTESWSCSIHGSTSSALETFNEANWAEALSQWFLRVDSHMPGTAQLSYFKANKINIANGKYLDENNAHTFFYPSPLQGVYEPFPPQIASVATLYTAKARGRASKGRVYLPCSNYNAVASDGRISAASATAIATSFSQLLTDLNGGFGGDMCVWSQVGQDFTEITGSRVGRVLDTQRRRRRNLVEDYQAVDIS